MELNQGKRFGNKAIQVIPLIQSVWIFLTGSPIDSRAGEQCIGYAQSISALWSIVIQHLESGAFGHSICGDSKEPPFPALRGGMHKPDSSLHWHFWRPERIWKGSEGWQISHNVTMCAWDGLSLCIKPCSSMGTWRSAWVEWVEWVEWASVRFKDWDQRTFPSTAGAALAALGLGSFSAAGHQLKRCSARWPPHQQWLSRDDGKDHLRWEEFGRIQDRMKFPKQKLQLGIRTDENLQLGRSMKVEVETGTILTCLKALRPQNTPPANLLVLL